MQEVSNWVFTICAGALVCGIVSALIPGKSYEKAIQLLLGIFMLFCFLMPVNANWRLPEVDISAAEQRRREVAGETEQQMDRKLEEDIAERLYKNAKQIIAELGINETAVDISILQYDNGDPVVEVTLPPLLREREQEIKHRMEDKLGVTVSLEWSESDKTAVS